MDSLPGDMVVLAISLDDLLSQEIAEQDMSPALQQAEAHSVVLSRWWSSMRLVRGTFSGSAKWLPTSLPSLRTGGRSNASWWHATGLSMDAEITRATSATAFSRRLQARTRGRNPRISFCAACRAKTRLIGRSRPTRVEEASLPWSQAPDYMRAPFVSHLRRPRVESMMILAMPRNTAHRRDATAALVPSAGPDWRRPESGGRGGVQRYRICSLAPRKAAETSFR